MSHTGTKKIIFAIRSNRYFHYYRTIIAALLRRGYQVRLLCDRRWSDESSMTVFEEFQKEFPQFSYGWAVPRTDRWRNFLFHTRELLSYRHYLLLHRQSRYYEERYFGYLGKMFQRAINFPGVKKMLKSRICGSVLSAMEHIAPAFPAVMQDIRIYEPDAVVASPVNMRFASAEFEYLKAAVRMGIPTAIPVISWDNLTTKGLFHVFPDILLVWNDAQQEEAIAFQGIPKKRIRIMGAPVFDVWFSHLSPSLSRDDYCKTYGLRSHDPIVLYLGSSAHMAKDETWLIEALRRALDSADDPRIRNTQIIVRPHPANSHVYERLNLKDVCVLPKAGTLPDSSATLQFFYDTLTHSVCAIDGANTSGIIDALIAGKPGVALLTDQYRATQSETVHFNQLMTADTLECAHGAQDFPSVLKYLLEGNDGRKEKREAFVARYVRPRGLDHVAGDVGAEEIDNLIKNL